MYYEEYIVINMIKLPSEKMYGILVKDFVVYLTGCISVHNCNIAEVEENNSFYNMLKVFWWRYNNTVHTCI